MIWATTSIVWKYDVIHETLCRQRTTEQKKIDEDRTCITEDMIADNQTHKHTDTVMTILRSGIGGGVNILYIVCQN